MLAVKSEIFQPQSFYLCSKTTVNFVLGRCMINWSHSTALRDILEHPLFMSFLSLTKVICCEFNTLNYVMKIVLFLVNEFNQLIRSD